MKTRTPLGIALAAAAALAGCNQEDHNIIVGPPGSDDSAIAGAPVALPPSISVSKIYRCADNQVVYVDWLSDNKAANLRTKADNPPIQVAAAEPGQPMTAAGGYSIDGTSGAASVRITVPGHPSQSCKA